MKALRDGVHLSFENPGGAWGFDLHHESWAYGTSEGGKLSSETTPDVSAMGPGNVTVACTPTSRTSYFDDGVPTGILTILDPDGFYVPWELSCGPGDQFRTDIAADADEDPTDVVRRVPGVLASDDLKPPGYPKSLQHWPTYVVIRDGTEVARIGAPRIEEGRWQLLVNACPGSGIPKGT